MNKNIEHFFVEDFEDVSTVETTDQLFKLWHKAADYERQCKKELLRAGARCTEIYNELYKRGWFKSLEKEINIDSGALNVQYNIPNEPHSVEVDFKVKQGND